MALIDLGVIVTFCLLDLSQCLDGAPHRVPTEGLPDLPYPLAGETDLGTNCHADLGVVEIPSSLLYFDAPQDHADFVALILILLHEHLLECST